MRLLFASLVGLAAAEAGYRYGSYPMAQNGLIPRFLIDRSFPIARRDASCDEDHHSCLDVGFGDSCCDNESYCYVNKEGDVKCCPIGSNCVSDSDCKSTAYQCTRAVTTSGTVVSEEGCCGRKCPATSQFLCPASLGGNCCPFGAECRAGGDCAETQTATQSALLTPVVQGCTTSQFKCSDGKGCCDDWQHCTDISGTGYCAAGNPSDTSISVVEQPSSGGGGGLSSGAKAGIAIGAVVGTGIIVGAITWLCISKRRQRRRERMLSQQRPSGNTGGEPVAVGDGMTDITSVSRNRPRRGLTQDYFGPDAVPGPFTETAESDATSPGPPGRAVPSRPQAPGDITAPVEIDSTAVKEDPTSALSPMTSPSLGQTPSETIDGRFELYGSDMPLPRRSSSIMATPPLSIRGQAPTDQAAQNETSGESNLKNETSSDEHSRQHPE